MKNKISMAVIRRLPKYYRYLKEMIDKGVDRTSSRELSEIIGFSASQIRQDFNNFGEFGQQGYGYNVKALHGEIVKIIGLDKEYNMIVIGCGNLARALINYGFGDVGFTIQALFDNDPAKIGTEFHGVEILDTNILETYLSKNDIDTAILCVPGKNAQGIADRLMVCGLKSIWNFSPVDLRAPEEVTVENVHLVDSLMTITYLINK